MLNFQLKNNDGTDFDLKKYQAKDNLLLVFFRGSWCGFCKKQLLELQKNLKEFKNKKIKIVAISSDTKLKSSILKTFFKLDFPVLADEKLEVIEKFKIKTEFKKQIVAKSSVFYLNNKQEVIWQDIKEGHDEFLSVQEILGRI